MRRLLSKMYSERGFSLIEVVASIVIIGLVLISFSQLFIQSNKTAAYNNEKLVTINLADAVLAKIKNETFTKNPSIKNFNEYFVKPGKTEIIEINDKKYTVSYNASQSYDKTKADAVKNSIYTEKDLDLIKVVVTVTAPNGKTKGSTEGYVVLE